MTDAPNTSSYVLVNLEGNIETLPNSRKLKAEGGLLLEDTGSFNELKVTTTGNLAQLNSFTTPGMVSYNSISGYVPRTFQNGTGITITNPDGQDGDPIFNSTPASTVQLTNVLDNGLLISTRPNLSFSGHNGISVTITDNSPVANAANINITGSGTGADANATYILQKSDTGLPNAQSLGDLTNGLLKVFVTDVSGGTIQNAVAGTDYQAPSAILNSIAGVTPAIGTILVGTGTGFEVLIPGDAGTVITSQGIGLTPRYEIIASNNSIIVVPDTGTTQVVVNNTNYLVNNTSTLTTFELPTLANCTAGTYYRIEGFGVAGWTLTQRAGQQVTVGTVQTTAGSGGSISSTVKTDSIIVYCIATDNSTFATFVARPTSGQVSVV